MKEWMNIIKEDINLLSQFQFYKALENCSSSNDIKEYVNESLDLVRSGINVKTLSKYIKTSSLFGLFYKDFISSKTFL